MSNIDQNKKEVDLIQLKTTVQIYYNNQLAAYEAMKVIMERNGWIYNEFVHRMLTIMKNNSHSFKDLLDDINEHLINNKKVL